MPNTRKNLVKNFIFEVVGRGPDPRIDFEASFDVPSCCSNLSYFTHIFN